jgi:hypothetical protein
MIYFLMENFKKSGFRVFGSFLQSFFRPVILTLSQDLVSQIRHPNESWDLVSLTSFNNSQDPESSSG